MPGQQVYIQDEQNFCINLPNPNSIFLQNNYYNRSLLPTVVQAEGFVQSFCVGNYLPPGSSPMPQYGIRSAHVLKNFTVPGQHYIQIHGQMDCVLLNINCTQSSPGAYDDGGQYDDGGFVSCGKEPYSGTDASKHPGFPHYVEQAGDGNYCMRICEAGAEDVGLPCDLTQDTKGCIVFMRVSFTPGFSYADAANPGVISTISVSLPPLATPTTSPLPNTATNPDVPLCRALDWYIPTPDPCYPLTTVPMPGQQVYIKDMSNFCINLPNPNSIFLQNNYYNATPPRYPTINQGEGFVQAFCLGSYLPPGALPMPQYAVRSAHVSIKNAPGFGVYHQVYGTLDCTKIGTNCTMSAPGAYDDGGQIDDAPYKSCGKSPYSGVDNSTTGNPGMVHYVEQAGNSLFCMRVCGPGTMVPGGPCDVTQDTAGCHQFMGVPFNVAPGFTFTDLSGAVTSTSVFMPPLATATSASPATSNTATVTNVQSAAVSGTATAVQGAGYTAALAGIVGIGALLVL
ncbi:hypothetical protein HDU98_011418 [Podochytrium sp. JEL0797]|nr:hypothetical protein HDU98_011418 [Podochytrium sp. JEL0797]